MRIPCARKLAKGKCYSVFLRTHSYPNHAREQVAVETGW